MTVTEVKGLADKGPHGVIPRCRVCCGFLPKIKIDVVVDDDMLEQSLEVICNTASTGKVGDGKIFVSSLDEVVRIRTGETGSGAI
ncbi:MAG: nitrogen regulatory protein P-II 1 [Pseudomonadota bacterium]|nr:MAG: nitrogen regulatory protein P-II 1 [Pseudomonadota bacterium]